MKRNTLVTVEVIAFLLVPFLWGIFLYSKDANSDFWTDGWIKFLFIMFAGIVLFLIVFRLNKRFVK